MKLIAKKPCSFGGQQFFIGNEVPADLVADPTIQERLGVIAIVNAVDSKGVTDGRSDAPLGQMFTQEEVDNMIAEAVEKATSDIQRVPADLRETEPGAYEGAIQIAVKGESSGENEQEQNMMIPATPEEIQQAFSIMQLNADESAKAITEVISENVLILLHASDSRKAVKKAAKERAHNLFSTNVETNESDTGNTSAGTNIEGADT